MVLFVNGLPVVVIETKTPVSPATSWLSGAKDITNVYIPEGPSFFAPNILCAAQMARSSITGPSASPPPSG